MSNYSFIESGGIYAYFSQYHRCKIGLVSVRLLCEIFLTYTVYYYAASDRKQTLSAVGKCKMMD